MTEPATSAEFIAVQQALAGEYSLERELGRGGMGIVYLAQEVELERRVAVKVLPAALARRVELRERFLREARTAARLSHPHVVPIHRVGERNGVVFFAMTYVEGETLGDRVRARGALPPHEVARVLREVAWALAYAHAQGVVHRDVKPDNILLERATGRALVTDFGIAQRAVHGEAALTDPEQLMGTAAFMSPEQAESAAPVDGRSDLYALGVVGYLALAGRLPFDGRTAAALLAQRLTQLPLPVARAAGASVPPALALAIDRCLARDPERRFADGEALAAALEGGAAPQTSELPAPLRTWLQPDPVYPAYVAWTAVWGTAALWRALTVLRHATLAQLLRATHHVGHRGVLAMLAIAMLPLAPALLFQLRRARAVLRAGHGVADLRLALRRWTLERSEEVAYELRDGDRPFAWSIRLAFWGAVLSAAFINGHGMPRLGGVLGWPIANALATISAIVIPGGALLANALGVPLLGGWSRRLAARAPVRTRFWNGRLGAWAARRLGGARATAGTQLVGGPTEMALGMAAADLHAALPRTLRDQFAEVPAVAGRLEAHAAACRTRLGELNALLASAERSGGAAPEARGRAVDELRAARDAARDALRQSVAALEGLRLGLLRLHGAGDAAHATTALDLARQLGGELDALASARREVEAAVAPRRPITPIATPV